MRGDDGLMRLMFHDKILMAAAMLLMPAILPR